MDLMDVFRYAAEQGASDIFIVADAPISVKVCGHLHPLGNPLPAQVTEQVVGAIYKMAQRDMTRR